MAHNYSHLIDAYRRLQHTSDVLVLASVVETFGSTYQKAGAKMLIAGNGETHGLLGGGCFEHDLAEQAKSVFATGAAKTVFYDMRASADVIWGLGLGCNGAVKVLLQRLTAERDYAPLNVLAEASETDTSGVLVTCYDSQHHGYPLGTTIFLRGSTLTSQASTHTQISPFLAPAAKIFSRQRTEIGTQTIEGHSVKALYDFIRPPLRLLIIGAGVDALPLVQYAAALGWQVTVADHRPNYIKPERFPLAKNLLLALPEEAPEKLAPTRFDALVLMTHNFDYDRRYLQQFAASGIAFIGLLGPAQRRDKLLSSLGTIAERIRSRVFGPVGLDIGAQTPEEIALSIVAGIQAAISERSGEQLDPGHLLTTEEQSDDRALY